MTYCFEIAGTIFRGVGDVCTNKNPHVADEYVGAWLKEFCYIGCAEEKGKLQTTGGLKYQFMKSDVQYVYVCLAYGFTAYFLSLRRWVHPLLKRRMLISYLTEPK